MLRRTAAAAVALLAIVLAIVVPTTAANAAGGMFCDNGVCYMQLSSPPSDPAPSPDANGWTPGAPTCYYETSKSNALQMGYSADQIRVYDVGSTQYWYVIIDCGSDVSYWSNSRQCYIHMVNGAWPARPSGFSQEAGYYECIMFEGNPGGGGPGLPGGSFFWSETVPPGLKVLTPGAAAAKLIESFQLQGIEIGMAPQVNPAWGHRRSYVGVPVWLWAANPQPLTWGPYTQTATLGGQTITATAQVTGVRWGMGDGRQVVCGNVGTAYTVGYGLTDSPTCGYRYTKTSSNQPGDRFTVTATSMWSVTWTSLAGPGGTINLERTSTADVEINEIQSVNVTPVTPNG